MTDEEKKQLVDAVITQLKNEGTDVSNAKIEEDVNGISYVICYNANGEIVRASTATINQQESTNKEALAKINQNAISFDSLEYSTTTDDMSLEFKTLDGKSNGSVTFPTATTESAGVMTAEDKVALNNAVKNITDEIERSVRADQELRSAIDDEQRRAEQAEKKLEGQIANEAERATAAVAAEKTRAEQAEADAVKKGRQLALRALFVAAGAEYNDSGADKTKTALWGENVTHKAEHYYLNGLGDITEEQMVKIYNRGNFNDADIAPLSDSFSHANNIRTNLPRVGKWNGNLQAYLCLSNKRIEVLTLHVAKFSLSENCNITFSSTVSLFEDSSALSVIDTRCRLVSSSWSGSSFKNCASLKEVRIGKLENNIVFAQSSQLSKASVLFAIEKAIPTAPISITLHPEAYSRLAEDADIVAALEAQPLVTLVSA